jgi:hypothetical protein
MSIVSSFGFNDTSLTGEDFAGRLSLTKILGRGQSLAQPSGQPGRGSWLQ